MVSCCEKLHALIFFLSQLQGVSLCSRWDPRSVA